MKSPNGYRLGIVNPLTLVGNEIKTILRDRAFPFDRIALLDSTGEVAGALTIASIVNYAPAPVNDARFAYVMLFVTIFVSFSMVSPVRYRSQKGLNMQKERSLVYFLAFALILAVAMKWPKEFFFIGAILYLLSGPFTRLWSIAFPPRHVDQPPPDVAPVEHTP